MRLALGTLCLLTLSLMSCRPEIAPPPSVDAPVIVPRSVWGAQPEIAERMEPTGTVRFVTIHHTETPASIEETTHLRSIQRGHQEVDHAWGDIAYHYLIGPSGAIYEGRAERFAPSSGTVYLTPAQWSAAPQNDLGQTTAAIPLTPDGQEIDRPGASAGHLLISVLGDYSEELPTPEARDAVVRLAAAKLYEHGLTADDVYFHREVAVFTDCPGQRFYDWFRGPTRQRGARGEGLQRIAAELDRLRAAD